MYPFTMKSKSQIFHWENHDIDVVIDSSGIYHNVIDSKNLIGRVKK